jgi:hypothetical protein
LRFFLWSRIQETEQWEREATAMALAYYNWRPDLPPDNQMEAMVRAETETVLYHELGEALDRSLPQGLWKNILSAFPQSRIELYLRTLKDLLADTHPQGTLSHIIREQKAGSLAFYLSNLKGLRRSLFPEIVPAIRCFKEKEDWPGIERARKVGRRRLVGQTRRIRELAEQLAAADKFSQQFEKEFFRPLGLETPGSGEKERAKNGR